MRPVRTKRGTLIVPVRVQEGELRGDGVEEIGPDHPEFKCWSVIADRYEALAERDEPRPRGA